MDELSQKAFHQAVQIIGDTIAAMLNRDIGRKGFFSPFVNITDQMNTRFKSLLFKKLKGYLGEMEFKISQGDQITFSSVRLKPDWLNYETYEKICYGDISSIGKDLLLVLPRQAKDHRHVGGFFPESEFGEAFFLSEVPAVVAPQDDDSIFCMRAVVERV